MSFIADKQTTDDLNLLGKHRPHSIYRIFCRVETAGGERLLEEMFRHPLTDADAINRRSNVFQYLQSLELTFPLDPVAFRTVEDYLGSSVPAGFLQTVFSVLKKKITAVFLRDEKFDSLQKGLRATLEMLNKMRVFLQALPADRNSPWFERVEQLRGVLAHQKLSGLNKLLPATLPVIQLAKLDHLFNHTLAAEMKLLVQHIHELDVYISVGNVAREKRFSYAHALPGNINTLKASGVWHPSLAKAVPNPVQQIGRAHV